MQAPITASPINAMERRPNESEKGPANGANIAQVKDVAAISCPATATDVSNSLAIPTNKGPSISATVLFRNSAAAMMAKALSWPENEELEGSEVIRCSERWTWV